MSDEAVELYLDLMKRCLTRTIFPEGLQPWRPIGGGGVKWAMSRPVRNVLTKRGVVLAAPPPVVPGARDDGRDWPSEAETMIGMKRLDNIQLCVTDVVRQGVPGDLIETGVWRGGATIFMRAILAALGDRQRTVWVADSFEGLPKPDPARYPLDAGDDHWQQDPLKVSLERVKSNFARYGLLDDQVRFLKGWFRDTLPTAPIEQLAVARLDGDMYESTMDALQALYPKVSVGGYVIVDDYSNEGLVGCKAAVDDYRRDLGVTDPLEQVDWTGVFWKKTTELVPGGET
ncbi:MAG TPA: TylF/MycF family methyltransferase [Actinomycetota bacterium]|nr:TylF/MycF family methyltransferase [Actinomycetota bacterium]